MEKPGETTISAGNGNVDSHTKMLRGENALPDYIRKAFDAEFYAWPEKISKSQEIEQGYEKRVRLIMGAVAEHLKLGREEKHDPEKVKEKVSKADEPELYRLIKDILYRGLKGSYQESASLSSIMLENKFNCFTASLIVWDAMRRMGKEMQGVQTNNHFFLVGKYYAFDAVSDNYVFSKHKIPMMYKKHEIISNMAERMSGAVCIQYALMLRGDSGRQESQKVVSLSKAGLQNASEMDISKGQALLADALAESGQTDEARSVCQDALRRNPTNAFALDVFYNTCKDRSHLEEFIGRADIFTREAEKRWHIILKKGTAQAQLGKTREALETCREVLRIDPRNPYALLLIAFVTSRKRPRVAIRMADMVQKEEYKEDMYKKVKQDAAELKEIILKRLKDKGTPDTKKESALGTADTICREDRAS